MYTPTTKTEFIPVSPVPFYSVSQCLPSCLPCLQNTFVDLDFSMYIHSANHNIYIQTLNLNWQTLVTTVTRYSHCLLSAACILLLRRSWGVSLLTYKWCICFIFCLFHLQISMQSYFCLFYPDCTRAILIFIWIY